MPKEKRPRHSYRLEKITALGVSIWNKFVFEGIIPKGEEKEKRVLRPVRGRWMGNDVTLSTFNRMRKCVREPMRKDRKNFVANDGWQIRRQTHGGIEGPKKPRNWRLIAASGEGRKNRRHVFFTAGLVYAFTLRSTSRGMTNSVQNSSTMGTQIPDVLNGFFRSGRLNGGKLVYSNRLLDFDRDWLGSPRVVVHPGNVDVARNHIYLGLSRDA